MNRKQFLYVGIFLFMCSIYSSCKKFDRFFDHSKGRDKNDLVYINSNEPGENKVLIYKQHSNGELKFKTAVPTGGEGTGAGLGSQGAVIVSKSGEWLYTVNAGDNTISVFKISSDGDLMLYQTINSGGSMPVSLDVYDKLLYVVNAGGNICGFRIMEDGKLEKLTGSEQPLSAADAGPAQISFKPGGKVLVVTEKNTNSITTYVLDESGVAGGSMTVPAEAETPFGFAFAFHDKLIVTNAFGGRPDESEITSYKVEDDGTVNLISRLPVFQAAACWIVLSRNQEYGFITNTASNSITSIKIKPSGELVLLNSVAAMTGEGPIDICIDSDQKFAYAVSQKSQTISEFKILPDGKLKHIGEATGLTPAASGMAIYR